MNTERLMQVLLYPHVSEKATQIAEAHKQFVFEVLPDANKLEVKQAVELMFKVEVVSVQVCNLPGKKKRFKNAPGRRKGLRKAYVRLKPGFDIDFLAKE